MLILPEILAKNAHFFFLLLLKSVFYSVDGLLGGYPLSRIHFQLHKTTFVFVSSDVVGIPLS